MRSTTAGLRWISNKTHNMLTNNAVRKRTQRSTLRRRNGQIGILGGRHYGESEEFRLPRRNAQSHWKQKNSSTMSVTQWERGGQGNTENLSIVESGTEESSIEGDNWKLQLKQAWSLLPVNYGVLTWTRMLKEANAVTYKDSTAFGPADNVRIFSMEPLNLAS